MANFTITVPDPKLQDFKDGFLKVQPVPIGSDGNPTMTENQWIRHWILEVLRHNYRTGKQLLAQEAAVPVIDNDIVS